MEIGICIVKLDDVNSGNTGIGMIYFGNMYVTVSLPHGNDFTEKLVGVNGNRAVSMPNGVYIFGNGGSIQFLPNGQKEWKTGKLVDYSILYSIFVDSWS